MLSNKEKDILKAKAHHLKAVVMIGQNGLSDAVLNEIDVALTAHELIKIKVSGVQRDEKNMLTAVIAEKTQSIFIQNIGHVFVFYRKNEDAS